MSTHLEPALREALSGIAEGPPPAGLAGAALRTARRTRQVRLAIAGVTAAAALLAASAVPAATSLDLPPFAAQADMWPLVVTAYSGTASPARGSLLQDRATGEYVELPYLSV
jgi:hypothetical protein